LFAPAAGLGEWGETTCSINVLHLHFDWEECIREARAWTTLRAMAAITGRLTDVREVAVIRVA
jgi:hypothetical protein